MLSNRAAQRFQRSLLTLLTAFSGARAATEFGQANGLPNLAVSSLGFDADGFLLAGTDRGLYRLEGNRFRPFGPELTREPIRGIATASDGSVWVAGQNRLWMSPGDGSFRPVSTGRGIRSGPAGLAANGQGRVFVISSGGLYSCSRQDGCTWMELDGKPEAVAIDRQGIVWAAGQRIWKIAPTGVPVTAGGADGAEPWKSAVAAPDGRVWFRSEKSLAVWEPDRAALRAVPRPERSSSPFPGIAAASDGSLIAASGESMWMIAPPDFAWRPVTQPPSHSAGRISALAAGPDGSLWAGLDGSGVSRYPNPVEWATWTRASGLASDNIKAIHRDARGHVWIGAESFLYEWLPSGSRLTDGSWTRRLPGQWERSDSINSVIDDPGGNVWVGLESGLVVRWDPRSGRVSRRKMAWSVHGLAATGDSIIVLTERGPFSARWDGQLDFQPEAVDGSSNRLYSLERGPKGLLYATGMGLLVRDSGRWRQARKEVAGQRLRRATFGPDGAVWAGYHQPQGLDRLSAQSDSATRFDSTNALLSDRVTFLGTGGDGRIWVGTDSGIHAYDGKNWQAWDQTDGLAWNHTNSRAFADGGGGSVWIGTARGAVRFRPRQGVQRFPVKIVRVEPVGTAGPDGLTFAPGSTSIGVEFAVPRYAPEQRITYQYRLEGIDRDWIPIESPRVRFGSLAPGNYRLAVRARLDHGPWNLLEQPLRFRLEPSWWQGPWAVLAYALIALASAWGLIRLRIRAGIERERKLALLVEERTRDLASARDAAIEAGHAKAAFLAKMSHEIRTPLNGVIGTLGLLRGSFLDARQSGLTDLAIGSAENLLSVINSVLDFSKIESGRMDIERVAFRLRDVVRSAVSLMQARASAKRLGLSCEISAGVPVTVVSDPVRLRQILLNLLSNAIKFTESGTVELRVSSVGGPTDARVRFDVIDTGIGIPEAGMDKLFRPFSQVDDSTTRLYGGTGLGLAISRQICELMGGTIGVESQEGKGSVFWFELPADIPLVLTGSTEQSGGAVTGQAPASPRILLAEDNLANRRVAEGMLEFLGLTCEVASNGGEAIEMMTKTSYDVILLDCQMPHVDGYEVARRVRGGETANPAIRIVALTANALDGDRERCIAAGMDDYLPKPFTPAALDDAIRGAARRV